MQAGGGAAAAACGDWPQWQRFQARYLSADGRVVDASTSERATVSEAQAYALLFALVAADRAAFDRILAWTRDNLAGGDLARALPAWHWGQAADGQWRVLDGNAAADADTWLAYALLNAGRLWSDPTLTAQGRSLAALVLERETAELPGLGLMLLPAPRGFEHDGYWTLNPSYLPLQLLRGLATLTGRDEWSRIAAASLRLLRESAPLGLAPDWVDYSARGGFASAGAATRGSYAAIRVYLWAGMLPPGDPARARLQRWFHPVLRGLAQAAPAESYDVHSGLAQGTAPPGYSAALLPLLEAAGDARAAARQRQVAAAADAGDAPRYYSDALSMFGLGFHDRRFGFSDDGLLLPSWTRDCGNS